MAAWSEGSSGEAAHTHRFGNRRLDPGPDPPSLPVGVAGAARYPPSGDRALPGTVICWTASRKQRNLP